MKGGVLAVTDVAALRTVLIGTDPPPMVRPRATRRTRALRAFVFILALMGGLSVLPALSPTLPASVGVVIAIGVAGPFALLPARPLLAWRLAWVAALVVPLLPLESDRQPFWPWFGAQTLLLFPVLLVAVAARHPTNVVAWVWIFTSVLVLAFSGPGIGALPITAITLLLLLGDQVRRRRIAQHSLAAQAALRDREQARRAALEERTRIARELHDVVAHHMSLIAVRAETAPYRIDDVPEQTRTELAAVAQAAREALTEMRRLLGVLRSESTDPELGPQPGLTDVESLVSTARQAGVPVQLQRTGDLSRVPAAVGLSGFRIVQEALSNASRHAPGAPVRARLSVTSDALGIHVTNAAPPADGARPRPAPPAGSGAHHGILGMRERVRTLGGAFGAGPTVNGGFEVRATIPLQEAT